ncbi:thymidine phosphorylase [bacterium]|nr:thymidine phosphorylase [bacterium]
MNMVELIERKRDGGVLSDGDITRVVKMYAAGDIPDYQMSALLMAVFFQGMKRRELDALTAAMLASGETADLTGIDGVKVDKHSTGGVGDKVSIILAPLVAAAGVPVPMMSGRGLGHTGGTLDKLESIPGFRTGLDNAAYRAVIRETGFAMIGQSERMVPADRKMYALRDVTGCVPSIPLICSSIISKKKAEGADALVLDVKTGSGAFLPGRKDTLALARELVRLGNSLSLATVAQLTAMDEPLGLAVGNWLEVKESIDCLHGRGPDDVMAVVKRLGALMLILGGRTRSLAEGERMIMAEVRSGEGFRRLCSMVEMQGGDPDVLREPERMAFARYRIPLAAPGPGFVSGIDAREIGLAAVQTGAGRTVKEAGVDAQAGIVLMKKRGDRVEGGEPLAEVHTNMPEEHDVIAGRVLNAFAFSQHPVERPPLIGELIDPRGYVEQ